MSKAIPLTLAQSYATQSNNGTRSFVIAISSRALFDLSASHAIFEKEGVESFERYQKEHEDKPLEPGVGFYLVHKLLQLNTITKDNTLIEIILLSRNNANASMRIINSIKHHNLDIKRAAFCTGHDPHRYAKIFGCSLFLSSEPEDVLGAIQQGVAAAVLCNPRQNPNDSNNSDPDGQISFAFDGDSVIFSDESDKIYANQGLNAFHDNEQKNAEQPLTAGPFQTFFLSLQNLQKKLQEYGCTNKIRTALITARDTETQKRVINTLRHWDISVDETLFLGGLAKGPFVKVFSADIFFDNESENCESSTDNNIMAGRVVTNNSSA